MTNFDWNGNEKMIYLMNIWTIKSVMNSMNQIKIIKNQMYLRIFLYGK